VNIILLRPEDWLDASTVELRDRRHEHIRKVLKSSVGASLKVGEIGGHRGTGIVTLTSDDATQITATLTQPPASRHPFDIALALPRPKMLRRVLRTVAEMGVTHLHLIHSARVEKSFWQTPLLQPERISEALQAGLERSGDTLPPQIHLHRFFKPFIEDIAPDLVQDRQGWIAHQSAAQPISRVAGGALVLLGPEGGFVPYELSLAETAGFSAGHLGGRTLSVDTAVAAALSQALS
jgi:16S rRNA (uracil1498-N3)-methyltransferase